MSAEVGTAITVPSRGNAAVGFRPMAIVPQNMDEAARMSKIISESGLAPYGMKTAQQVMVAIMYGAELGLPAMQSIQSIAVINGKPALYGDAALGMIRASGLEEYTKEWIEGEGDARTAYCTMKRKGHEAVTAKFSVADAKKAGLWDERPRVRKRSKNGGADYDGPNDSPWYRFPDRMLKFRARGFCSRDVYPDLLKGLLIKEEMEEGNRDEGDEPPQRPFLAATDETGSRAPPPPPPPASENATAASEAPAGWQDPSGLSAAPPPPPPPPATHAEIASVAEEDDAGPADPVDAYCAAVIAAGDTDALDRAYDEILGGLTLTEEQHNRAMKADEMRRQMLEP